MNIFQIEDKVKQNPTSPLCVRLASLYLARLRIDEAMKLCNDSISRYPKYSTSYLILGRCYASLGHHEPAIFCAEKSLSLNPNSILSKILLSNWRQHLLKKQESISKDEFEQDNVYNSQQTTTSENNKPITAPDISSHKTIEDFKIDENIDPIKTEDGITIADKDDLIFISPTLAEIYANQKQYAESIKIYKALIKIKPEQKHLFEEKIKYLENCLNKED